MGKHYDTPNCDEEIIIGGKTFKCTWPKGHGGIHGHRGFFWKYQIYISWRDYDKPRPFPKCPTCGKEIKKRRITDGE